MKSRYFGWLSCLFGWGSSVYAQKVPYPLPESILTQAGFDTTFVAKCALFVAVLLLGTIFFGKVFKLLLRIPVIAGQILGGIILGPTFFNIQKIPFFTDSFRFADTVTKKLYLVVPSDLFVFFILLLSSAFTVSYLLWLAGYETNVRDLVKVGNAAVTAGILGALIPIIMTVGTLSWLYAGSYTMATMVAVGIVFAATSVSIPVAMLVASNKMHLKSSQATLGAAIVDDILAVVLLSTFMMSVQTGMFGKLKGVVFHGTHGSSLFMALIHMALTAVVIVSFGYFVIPPILKKVNKWKLYHLLAPLATITMLFYFSFAELAGGLAGITGAYFAGLFYRSGDKRRVSERVIAPFVNAILLPLFLGSIGLQVNLQILTYEQWIMVGILLVVAIISKLFGCYLAGVWTNLFAKSSKTRWSLLEMYIFGSSMVARGEVGLVVATILRGAQIITPDGYVLCVVVIILTTIAAPIMLSIGFNALDLQLYKKGKKEYQVCLGNFKVVGTLNLFNIITGILESDKKVSTRVRLSEGSRIIDVEGHDIRVIFSPKKGLLFEGDQHKIKDLITEIKHEMIHEVEEIQI